MSRTSSDREPCPSEDAGPAIQPVGTHDREWLEQVHPSRWTNPVPRDRYHLVVLGAGPGGLVCAAGAAALGARVALVERHLMGGDCLNHGCVPSKGLIRAARAWKDAATAAERFGGPPCSGPADFGRAMERMRRLRASLSRHDSAARFRDLGVDVFLGHGRFVAPDALSVGRARLRFRRAVIATGARASAPPIPGLAECGYLTNETLFDLTELPGRLVVIGAGPIGCEMGQAFARFGSRVSVLDRGGTLLPRDEPDAAAIVRRSLARDGVVFRFGARILGVSESGGEKIVRFETEGREESVAADRILVAAGRSPNVDDLGLDAARVAVDGRIRVDDRMRTTNSRIFALGDVASGYQFTHAADAQARIVLANALFFGRAKASRLVIPWTTYTSPELAQVGWTARDARSSGIPCETFDVPLSSLDRAVLDGDDEGFLRIVVKKRSDTILGATLVAERAGDLIGEIVLAMTARIGLAAIGRTVHPYPTQGEAIRKAADSWRRTKLTPRAQSALTWFFRSFR